MKLLVLYVINDWIYNILFKNKNKLLFLNNIN